MSVNRDIRNPLKDSIEKRDPAYIGDIGLWGINVPKED